jgi:Protein of unknown function (DUF3298)
MPNTPKKVKTTSSLERMSWIAAILSTVIAAVTVIWPVWTYFKSTGEASPSPSTSAVNSGNRAIIIQGSGNTVVAAQSASAETHDAGRFVEIEISDHMLDLQGKTRHEVHFPQISGKISHNVLDRINHFLRRSALTEYERYADVDEVRISYEVGLKDFNLLGINFEIFANGDRAAHPITSTSATTLDLETGSEFLLKDFFRSGYIKRLNDLVQSELISREQYYPCEKQRGTDVGRNMVSNVLESITGHAADACFKSISGDSQYYLSDTSLVIVFPKYSIAPGVDGDIEIPIHFKELQGILKPGGPLQRFL